LTVSLAQLLVSELTLVVAVAQIETAEDAEIPTASPVESTEAAAGSELVHVNAYALPIGLVLTVAIIRTVCPVEIVAVPGASSTRVIVGFGDIVSHAAIQAASETTAKLRTQSFTNEAGFTESPHVMSLESSVDFRKNLTQNSAFEH
jgi:hypothetical protein